MNISLNKKQFIEKRLCILSDFYNNNRYYNDTVFSSFIKDIVRQLPCDTTFVYDNFDEVDIRSPSFNFNYNNFNYSMLILPYENGQIFIYEEINCTNGLRKILAKEDAIRIFPFLIYYINNLC